MKKDIISIDSTGKVKFLSVLLLLALVGGAYLVIKFAPVYYERSRIQQVADVLTRRAQIVTLKRLQMEIKEQVQNSGINLRPEDFEVIEENGQVFIYVYYEREVHHPFGYVTILEFDIEGKP